MSVIERLDISIASSSKLGDALYLPLTHRF